MDRKTTPEAQKFWEKKEKEYNGKITYKTFARMLGSLNGQTKDLTGLLYLIDDQLVFEDFEKEGGLFGLIMAKKKSTWEKTTMIIPTAEITGITETTQKFASARLAGHPGPVKPMSSFSKFFSIVVNEILTEDGNGFYFEVLDKSSLKDAVEPA